MEKKILADILLPVYNEEHVLAKSVQTLSDFLQNNVKDFNWQITIGDNASTDNTLKIAKELGSKNAKVRVCHLNKKGRGRMVKHAWSNSDADVLAYMDIDLSTDLNSLIPLVEAIYKEKYSVAIGSRQHKGAKVKRGLKREIISRGYIYVLKIMLGFPFTDAQCGFKSVSKNFVQKVFPYLKDDEWFFDTELLYVAEQNNFKVKEIPVKWIEDTDSRVKILRTAWLDICGVFRMIANRKEIKAIKNKL